MNLILLHKDDRWLDERTVHLRDHRAAHIHTVLQSQVGETVRVGLVGGFRGLAVIAASDADGVKLTVDLALDLTDPPPSRHRFDIVLALPRPKMLRRILRTVAEFGVQNLHLIQTARVDKSYWHSPLLRPGKVDEALLAGMERSRDTIAPTVHVHKRFRPFVEDRLLDLCAGRPCWIAHQEAPQSLAQVASDPAVVMIGPEGGFVPFELDLAETVIARRVHLGVRTLSVDTALPAALAQALPL